MLFPNLYSGQYQDQLAACFLVAIIEMTPLAQAERKKQKTPT